MAEVHIIGQVRGAKNFPEQQLFCKWTLQHGNNWKVIAGKREGQTQVASAEYDKNCFGWSYPIDIHLATIGLRGWPKIYIEVYHYDWTGRSHFFGYGFTTVPTSPGVHIAECFTWRPVGSWRERFVQRFLGGGPQLKNPDLICSSSERYKLNTESMGVVVLEFGVILRNFHKFGVEYTG